MRNIPQSLMEALTGSLSGARLAVHSWYDGTLLKQNLPVDSWAMTWDGKDTALVQGKLDLSVSDQDGLLAPWGWDEPLSAGGTRLQTTLTVADVAVDLGWWLITGNRPEEYWRVAGAGLEWVSNGADVPVEADELMRLAQDYEFWTPEAPNAGATVVGEIKRLLQDVCPVVVGAGVVDRVLPSGLVYDSNRAAHVLDLARAINCFFRMTGDGALEVYSQARTAPKWVVKGRNGGALVRVQRQQSRTDILNGVASTSNDSTLEIRRLSQLQTGPLRYGGPAGWRIEKHTAIANTLAGVQDDADTYLANKNAAKTVPLDVTCVPHPGLQIGDWVRVMQPVIDGQEFPLDGIVTQLRLSGNTNGLNPMELTVEVSADDAQRVRDYLRRRR